MNQPTLANLIEMLRWKRPHTSGTEKAFVKRFIDTLPGVYADACGNRIVRVGSSSTLISCHIDTVHSRDGHQAVGYNNNTGAIALKQPNKDNASGWQPKDCLGADDGAGMFVAMSLIAANKPGLYVFHRGEERGGIGSSWIAKNTPELFDGIERAIAFDRRGQTDIITHQMTGMCCSDQFAYDLGAMLGMEHKPCDLGTFTDTANYTDIVAECTNVSVGYHYEHSSREWLDADYLLLLIESVLKCDFDSLKSYRCPGDSGDFYSRYNRKKSSSVRVALTAIDGYSDYLSSPKPTKATLDSDRPYTTTAEELLTEAYNLDCMLHHKGLEHCYCWLDGLTCCLCSYEGYRTTCKFWQEIDELEEAELESESRDAY